MPQRGQGGRETEQTPLPGPEAALGGGHKGPGGADDLGFRAGLPQELGFPPWASQPLPCLRTGWRMLSQSS